MILKEQFMTYTANEAQGVTLIEGLGAVIDRNVLREKKQNRKPVKLITFVKKCD